ncbi:MAG: 4Fe-4S dicluster domain-containing protein [Lentisphaerae bacterium]|nr:4Fe-4S dicluster domain-containing protein [Lentisphaerota bacterium]
MRRRIRPWQGGDIAPLERLEPLPEQVSFSMDAGINRCRVAPIVQTGAAVAEGEIVAQGESLAMHASVSGVVERADAEQIVIRRGLAPSTVSALKETSCPQNAADLARIAREMGLVGMGGGMFPASVKLGTGWQIHTLVVNAVECEPGIQIDEALILHDTDTVRSGIDCVTAALAIKRRVLVVKRTAANHIGSFAASCAADVLTMPNRYPAGAEKLIVARLDGRMPPAGLLPVQCGYLVLSVASLWAIGRWQLYREPSILRPLSLVTPSRPTRNLLVPIGTALSHILNTYGIGYNPEAHLLVTGGLMMGARATPKTPILKGTNAIFVQPILRRLIRPEEPCLLCGACFDVCPLNLHPIGMVERIKSGRRSPALATQLDECFLCGACSAVCPAEIPLVQYFRDAKRGLRA